MDTDLSLQGIILMLALEKGFSFPPPQPIDKSYMSEFTAFAMLGVTPKHLGKWKPWFPWKTELACVGTVVTLLPSTRVLAIALPGNDLVS